MMSVSEQPVSGVAAAAAVGLSVAAIWLLPRLVDRMRHKNPPGPWCLPGLGNFQLFARTGSEVAWEVQGQLRDKYGPVVTLMAGPHRIVFVLDAGLVQEGLLARQLSDRMLKSYSGDYFTEDMSDIFAAPNNTRWRFHRKISFSAFRLFAQSDQLESLVLNSFDSVVSNFLRTAEPQDVYETVYLLMYNIQCRMSYGKEYTLDDPEFQMLRRCVEEINQTQVTGLIVDLFPLLHLLPLKSTRVYKNHVDEILDWAKQLIQQKKADYDPNELNDIVDFLIKEQIEANKAGKGHLFEDVHLRQTLMDIFTAGTDTSAFTLYWTIMALSQQPQLQSRCYAEIASAVGADSTPTLAHRQQLPFTDEFLHEVMRYWPLVGAIPRVCNEDFELGGYAIRKGTQVLLSTLMSSYDPALFPDPHQFRPERFLDESGTKMAGHRRGFMPFGAGPRVCLGESIAKKTTFLLTVLLIQRFRFELPPGEEGKPGVSENSDIAEILPRRFQVRVLPRND